MPEKKNKTTMLVPFLTFEETKKRLGISEEDLLNLVAENKIEAVMKGREMHFKESDVKSLAQKLAPAEPEEPAFDLEPTAESGAGSDLGAVSGMTMEDFERTHAKPPSRAAAGAPPSLEEEELLFEEEDLQVEGMGPSTKFAEVTEPPTEAIPVTPSFDVQLEELGEESVIPVAEATGAMRPAEEEAMVIGIEQVEKAKKPQGPKVVYRQEVSPGWMVPLVACFLIGLLPFTILIAVASQGMSVEDLPLVTQVPVGESLPVLGPINVPSHLGLIYGGKTVENVRNSIFYDPFFWGGEKKIELPSIQEVEFPEEEYIPTAAPSEAGAMAPAAVEASSEAVSPATGEATEQPAEKPALVDDWE
ncbi:MAG: helix-turn-helix domain-containing protein [Planctomycetota bacterium]